jgi:uncharacterized protein (UPF0335 family)
MTNEEAAPVDNGIDPEQLMQLVQRIEACQAGIDEIAAQAREDSKPYREDIAEIKTEAYDAGFGKKELAAIIRKRRLEYKAQHAGDSLDLAQKANYEQMLESLERLAEEIGPLGSAALEHAREARQ